jgi:transposase
MPKPLSEDFRKRIIEAKQRGDTEAKIAAEKEVSKSTVTKIWALFRATGSYLPRPNPNGRKPRLSPQQLEDMRHAINAQPDITLQELKDKLCLPISIAGLSKIVRNKLNLRYKKKVYAPLPSFAKMSK